MQDKIATAAIAVAALCVVIGAIAHFVVSDTGHLIFVPKTWHMFAQTCLLFAIARALLLRAGPKGS